MLSPFPVALRARVTNGATSFSETHAISRNRRKEHSSRAAFLFPRAAPVSSRCAARRSIVRDRNERWIDAVQAVEFLRVVDRIERRRLGEVDAVVLDADAGKPGVALRNLPVQDGRGFQRAV